MTMMWILLIALVAPLVSGKDCKDRIPNCVIYERKFCKIQAHIPWMKRNCAKYCGLCSTSGKTTTTATPAGCKDRKPNCDIYEQKYCKIQTYIPWMKRNCAKYCGFCSTSGKTTTTATPAGHCGKVMIPQSRVIGGKDAKPGAWPWQIAMYNDKYNKFWCGGSLVNNKWIVTAAHCVSGFTAKDWTIKLGVNNRSDEVGKQTFGVSRIIVHPHYDDQLNNDIALMELDGLALFNNEVQPVCLPSSVERPDVGSTCYITGWGKMTHPGRSIQILQQLGLKIQSERACKRKNEYFFPITKQMICGANPSVQENQSGCHGDSGGPFVCQQTDGSWKLFGAVSWGSWKCDAKHAYTVFARISEFRSWIDGYIN